MLPLTEKFCAWPMTAFCTSSTKASTQATYQALRRRWSYAIGGSIVSHLLPEGGISYRSGHDAKPVDGHLYITRGKTARSLNLPGLTVKVIPGPGAVAGDVPYKKLFWASQPRWLLENLATGRGVGERVLKPENIEAELDKMLLIRGRAPLQ